VSGKSNEITALPRLLERLALAGTLVTIDAIGTQSAIAETILRRGGDHLLALKANRPATFARAVRAHRQIENRLHRVLDVVFKDDLARLRTGHGPANIAVVKHMALNLLSRAGPGTSLKNRRKSAGWNTACLEALLRQTA
jgi:predicted transposase YbfD/YdcC